MSLSNWQFIAAHLDQGRPVFVAHVAHNTRHSPGTQGAQLAVVDGDTTCGTIGGGIMEAQVVERAKEALATSDYTPCYETLYHRRNAPKDGSGRRSGLGCAGNQTNVYQVLLPARDGPVVAEIKARLSDDRPGRVEISSAGMTLVQESEEPLTVPIRFEEGPPWQLSLELLNWKRIAIVGGGHCGLALSRQMHHLDYAVTVIDNRPDVFTFVDNSFADHRVAVDDYTQAAQAIDFEPWTHVVVMTANIDDDIRALRALADRPYPYLGVMGAPAKLRRIAQALRDWNISDDAIAKFYAPIGLPMTSNTPAEIAVSIAAEILTERQRLFPFCRADDI